MLAAALGVTDYDSTKGHSNHDQADYLCPICIATAAIANALTSAPPVIPLQLTTTVIDRTIELVRFAVALPRPAFQSRGPPIS